MTTPETKQRLNTPVGFAKWAHVHEPREGFKKDQPPKYQIDVAFKSDDPAWAEFIAMVRAKWAAVPEQFEGKGAEKKPIPKQLPIKKEYDKEENPTGRSYVSFRTSVDYKPKVFDNFGQPLAPSIEIGNESKVVVNYTMGEYTVSGGGVNFFLNAVQVLELVEFKGSNAADFGFDTVPAPAAEGMSTTGGGAGAGAKADKNSDFPF